LLLQDLNLNHPAPERRAPGEAMSKNTIQVASRGTNNHTLRRRAGFVFKTDLQDVELDLDTTSDIEKFIALKEDSHLLVVGGPKLDEAKAELARRKKDAQLTAGAQVSLSTTVNFASRDDVEKALKARDDRAAFLESKNAELSQDNQDLREETAELREELDKTSKSLGGVLERLAKLEAAGQGQPPTPAPAPASEKPADAPKPQGKGGLK